MTERDTTVDDCPTETKSKPQLQSSLSPTALIVSTIADDVLLLPWSSTWGIHSSTSLTETSKSHLSLAASDINPPWVGKTQALQVYPPPAQAQSQIISK